MRLRNFRADAHASGGRIDVSWEIYPDRGESLHGTGPAVHVRRKTRDFVFPPAVADDPFTIYDGATFSADRHLAPRFELEESLRVQEEAEIEVLETGGGEVVERQRWVRTYLDAGGSVHHIQVRLADRGLPGPGLAPGTVYYYQVFGDIVPTIGSAAPYQATARATGDTRLGQRLYQMLPSVLQQHDERGDLAQLVAIAGDQLDLTRSLAESLPGLRDVDNTDHRYLTLLAHWLGWDLNFTAPIPIRRHEIKYAAALYRITGTLLGCSIWVKRLTGWQAEIQEFYRNVFSSNDLGNPDDPSDQGSRTVDTGDPQVLARIGRPGDTVDYTYDTGTSDQDWYANNCVGIFVKPGEGESVATVLRKRANLVNNLALFLPVNIRGVVIFDIETLAEAEGDAMNLLGESSDPSDGS